MRLARPDERRRWDATMAEQHPLGFRGFAGRGLRYVAEYQGCWLALIGWQSGAFKCRPRDLWIGWRQREQFPRLHLIANNTRMLMLCPPGTIPQSCQLCHGRQSAAAQLRLARTLRTSAGVGRNVRRSSPVRRHHVSCRQLDLRRSHARLRAQQRSLHRAPRVPQGDVPLPPATGRPRTAAGSPAMPLLGAPAPPGGSCRCPVTLFAARVRAHPRSSP